MEKFTFGVDFTPETVGDLKEFLESIKDTKYKDRDELKEFLQNNLDGIKNTSMAGNLVNSLINYKLLNNECELTEIAQNLINSKDIYIEFAKHIILELGGDKYLSAIEKIKKEGIFPANGENIIRIINKECGYKLRTSSKYFNNMRLWLQKAEILKKDKINVSLISEILGKSLSESKNSYFDLCDGLTYNQICFLKELIDMSIDSNVEYKGADIAESCESKYNVIFSYKTLKSNIIEPLEKKGLIEINFTKTGSAAKVKLSNKIINNNIYKKYIKDLKYINSPKLSFKESCDELFSADKAKRLDGKALEALTYYVVKLLGLSDIKIREKSPHTGNCEIDLLAVDLRLNYNKWQIQCKDTKDITSDRIAREVGVALITNANNLLFVFTGNITEPAMSYAKMIMKSTNINIYFIDRIGLELIKENPLNITKIITEQSQEINMIKK